MVTHGGCSCSVRPASRAFSRALANVEKLQKGIVAMQADLEAIALLRARIVSQ